MAVRRRRRRRRKRINPVGLILTLLFIGALSYLLYIVVTQPERLLLNGNKPGEAVPALAEAAETEPPGDSALPDEATRDLTDTTDETSNENSNETPNEINPYQSFSYYRPDKLSEYESFQQEHPDYDAETVTWMVNAGLNRPFFTDADINTDADPLLVNPYNRLPEDFTPLALTDVDSNGRQAKPEVVEAFQKMRAGANADGLDIAVQSAYRTIAYQQGLYDRAGSDGSVARPAYSEHHTGRALDLWGPDGLLDEKTPTETGRWVAEHAYEYGFIVRYTEENQAVTGYIPEPWHITYVGTAIAKAMHDNGIGSLEEYVAKNPGAALP